MLTEKKIQEIFDKWVNELVEAGLEEIARQNKMAMQAQDFIDFYLGHDVDEEIFTTLGVPINRKGND